MQSVFGQRRTITSHKNSLCDAFVRRAKTLNTTRLFRRANTICTTHRCLKNLYSTLLVRRAKTLCATRFFRSLNTILNDALVGQSLKNPLRDAFGLLRNFLAPNRDFTTFFPNITRRWCTFVVLKHFAWRKASPLNGLLRKPWLRDTSLSTSHKTVLRDVICFVAQFSIAQVCFCISARASKERDEIPNKENIGADAQPMKEEKEMKLIPSNALNDDFWDEIILKL